MRVISGTARGKKLETAKGLETRPTSDRVKEALFNIIQFDIKNSKVLDLFAGSGALGIEALSRGADFAVFSDTSLESIEVINKNLKNTKLEEKALVINKDYTLALKKTMQEGYKFDIIFLDPPYKSNFAVNAVEEIINLDILNNSGMIIVETDRLGASSARPLEELNRNRNLQIRDTRKYGRAILIFIGKEW
ncbi:MAG: 16S rRNA (guanine(966)-N(2))-methyltransferase RsmD [Firmicutes bacterium]|nr:16S rRNA (guanine(966)-N(2))-methyltransferase RsmD [Bacillota bacterium]